MLCVIADPESPRGQRWRVAGVTVLDWLEVIAGARPDADAVVRLESPGARLPLVNAMLDQSGVAVARPQSREELVPIGAWFKGFSAVLNRLHPTPRWVLPPGDVLAMFDKHGTRVRLQQAGVPVVPGTLVHDPADVVTLNKPFIVKPRYGSCANGILIYDPDAVRSTVHWRQGKALCGPLHELSDAEADATLQRICADDVVVEPLREHYRIGGDCVDFRVVVIDGEPRFVVPRISPHPITNLQLGGRRARPDVLMRRFGTKLWITLLDAAVLASRCYGSRSVGVDVLVDKTQRVEVLELNPFGDFFPGWRERGRSIEETLIEAYSRA